MKEILRQIRKYIDADSVIEIASYPQNFKSVDKRNFRLYKLTLCQKSLFLISPIRDLRPSFVIDSVSSLNVNGVLMFEHDRFLSKLCVSKRVNIVSPVLLFLPSCNCVLTPRTAPSTASTELTPNEQLILLKLLYDSPETFLAHDVSLPLGITDMTVFRALKKFSRYGVTYACEGPKNTLHRFSVDSFPFLYSSLEDQLFNPLIKTVYVDDSLIEGGILLETGMFGKNIGDEEFPARPIKAIYKKEIGKIEHALVSEEDGGTMVVVLNYDARKVAFGDDIDPITLSLLFQNVDESVSKAIKAWLNSYSWYK